MHGAVRDHGVQRRPPVGRKVGWSFYGQADAAYPCRAVTSHIEIGRDGHSVATVPVPRQVPACVEGDAGRQRRHKQLSGGGRGVLAARIGWLVHDDPVPAYRYFIRLPGYMAHIHLMSVKADGPLGQLYLLHVRAPCIRLCFF